MQESTPQLTSELFSIAKELEARSGRKCSPDGHMVGGIGDAYVISTKGLTPAKTNQVGHDATDGDLTVQIKTTTTGSITLSGAKAPAALLAAVHLSSDGNCTLRYYGPAEPVWAMSKGRKGQWTKAFSKLPDGPNKLT